MESAVLDRALQLELLTALATVYPSKAPPKLFNREHNDPATVRNLAYLSEHQLVEASLVMPLSCPPGVAWARITAQGMDFLADDGGISAMLNVVTVRLEADTLRALLTAKVEASAAPEEQKSRIKAWLQSAGEEGLKEATTRLVGAALDQLPDAVQRLLDIAG